MIYLQNENGLSQNLFFDCVHHHHQRLGIKEREVLLDLPINKMPRNKANCKVMKPFLYPFFLSFFFFISFQ